MPIAAPKPCSQCGTLVRDGTTRCEAHKVKAWSKPAEKNGRGGRPWRRLREVVMTRDGGLCQPSLRHGFVVEADEVDHIVPKESNGTDDLDNLEAISRDVHAAKSSAERLGRVWNEHDYFSSIGRSVR